jgi:hypothetical protein
MKELLFSRQRTLPLGGHPGGGIVFTDRGDRFLVRVIDQEGEYTEVFLPTSDVDNLVEMLGARRPATRVNDGATDWRPASCLLRTIQWAPCCSLSRRSTPVTRRRWRRRASGYSIAPGDPRHVDVTGDHAYVVVPATMTFDLRGQQIIQTGAVYTVGLRKVGADWRLTAWAWAKGA